MDTDVKSLLRREMSHCINRLAELNRMLEGETSKVEATGPSPVAIKPFRGTPARRVDDKTRDKLFKLYARMSWKDAQHEADVRPGQAWFNFHLWRMGDTEADAIAKIVESHENDLDLIQIVGVLKEEYGGNADFWEMYAKGILDQIIQ